MQWVCDNLSKDQSRSPSIASREDQRDDLAEEEDEEAQWRPGAASRATHTGNWLDGSLAPQDRNGRHEEKANGEEEEDEEEEECVRVLGFEAERLKEESAESESGDEGQDLPEANDPLEAQAYNLEEGSEKRESAATQLDDETESEEKEKQEEHKDDMEEEQARKEESTRDDQMQHLRQQLLRHQQQQHQQHQQQQQEQQEQEQQQQQKQQERRCGREAPVKVRVVLPESRVRESQVPEVEGAIVEVRDPCAGSSCLHETFRIFASFEESGGADPAGALARLRALRRGRRRGGGSSDGGQPDDLASALQRCAEAILACGECRSSSTVVDASLDLLAAAAAESEAADGSQGRLLEWLSRQLGGSIDDGASAQAPRDRAARCRAADLLWRLLPRSQSSRSGGAVGSSASPARRREPTAALLGPNSATTLAVLQRLAKDRSPAVRLAAIRGLAMLAGEGCVATLLALASRDPTPAVRAAAIAALGESGAAAQAAGRCLDVSAKVRRRLFAALAAGYRAQSKEQQAPELPVDLVFLGLQDASNEVRLACERTLCAWLSKSAGSAAPLLCLTERLLSGSTVSLSASGGGVANEAAAEAALKTLLSRDEWAQTARTIAARGPLGASTAEVASGALSGASRALLWRVAWSISATQQEPEAVPAECIPLTTQAMQALRSGQICELRQLLTALLSVGGSTADLLELAKAVMLEGPPEPLCRAGAGAGCGGSSVASSSVVGLAVALARQALGGGSGRQGAALSAEAAFNSLITEVLDSLWTGAGSSSGQGLADLGPRFDELLARQAPMTELASVADDLSALTLRALALVEEGLRQSSAIGDGAMVQPIGGEGLLLERWLCPALTRADAAEPVLGGPGWAAQRALAVRCMAMFTSSDPEVAASHWPFFLSVLGRYGPIAASLTTSAGRQADGACQQAAEAAEVIAETCVLFLSDVLLLHGGRGGWLPDSDERATELFSALMAALGPPSVAGSGGSGSGGRAPSALRPPPALRQRLSERLCTLMLYGSAWSADTMAPYAGGEEDLQPHLGASWCLTWLMLEAFHRPPPGPSATALAESAALRLQDTQEAAHRGRLLCFFGCLGRASAPHAALLASAGEILLSTELWRLGAQRPLSGGGKAVALAASAVGVRRWRPVQLPRLIRLLCQQLSACCVAGTQDARGAPGCAKRIAELWLTSVWRPLSLLCLEAFEEESLLAELLQVALSPIEAVSGGQVAAAGASLGSAPLSAATEVWPEMVREVSYACQRIADAFQQRASEKSSAANSGIAQAPQVAPLLRRVSDRLAQVRFHGSEPSEDEALEDWNKACKYAKSRRQQLRNALKDLGVDAKGLVASAAETLRARVSRVSLSQREAPGRRKAAKGRSKRRASLGEGALVALSSLSASSLKRKRLRRPGAVSDDDSDGPGPPSSKRPSSSLLLGRPGGG